MPEFGLAGERLILDDELAGNRDLFLFLALRLGNARESIVTLQKPQHSRSGTDGDLDTAEQDRVAAGLQIEQLGECLVLDGCFKIG